MVLFEICKYRYIYKRIYTVLLSCFLYYGIFDTFYLLQFCILICKFNELLISEIRVFASQKKYTKSCFNNTVATLQHFYTK